MISHDRRVLIGSQACHTDTSPPPKKKKPEEKPEKKHVENQKSSPVKHKTEKYVKFGLLCAFYSSLLFISSVRILEVKNRRLMVIIERVGMILWSMPTERIVIVMSMTDRNIEIKRD